MTVFFVLGNTKGSATGLSGGIAGLIGNQEVLAIYSMLGYLFPAFVALCLIGSVFRDVAWGGESGANAVASWIMLAGLVGVMLQPILLVLSWSAPSLRMVQNLNAFLSLAGICIALSVMWLANRRWFLRRPGVKTSRPVLRLVGPDSDEELEASRNNVVELRPR